MSSDTILKVENVAKQYRLGLVGTGTISHDLNRWWNRIRGKDDPYLQVGEANNRSQKANSDYVWALKDINFDVKRGEVLGIIGKNGAGKSTLLKILSRVTSPTLGEIKTKGRIASLLEVGTGFHPEMTGRENIYLNGAILGMTKAEITSKIDEIIEFSGCLRYVDTPVKRYSSGMKVRLAFAVAAHLEPDILVVDEVLAVGDAEFQKKAVGKMQDISNSEGRTVLFVSHNMVAVENLCTRVVVLNNGRIEFNGGVQEGIEFYLKVSTSDNDFKSFSNDNFVINRIELLNSKQEIIPAGILGKPLMIQIEFDSKINVQKFVAKISIKNNYDEVLFVMSNYHKSEGLVVRKNSNVVNCFIDKLPVYSGDYIIDLQFIDLELRKTIFEASSIFSFFVEDSDYYNTGLIPTSKSRGRFMIEHKWFQE
jgi:lipopolysaccharide transport system ATP-binding protein